MSDRQPQKSSMEEIADRLESGDLKILELDDTFVFDCKTCGMCCVNQTIILNTYDLIQMRKALNMTTSEMISRDFLGFHIGPHSKMPICYLKFDEVLDDKLDACPFMAPVRSGSTGELEGEIEGDIEEMLKNTKSIGNQYGDPVVFCAIHEGRPLRCRLWPLGRFFKDELEKPVEDLAEVEISVATSEEQWFLLDMPSHCKATLDAEPKTVRQWIEDQSLRPYLDNSVRCMEMMATVRNDKLMRDDLSTQLMFNLLYNFDPLLKKMDTEDPTDDDILGIIETLLNQIAGIADAIPTEE